MTTIAAENHATEPADDVFPGPARPVAADGQITLFLCGDVMTGRGIDQIMPHPGEPRIHEPYMQSARGYVALAEQRNGPVPAPVDFAYIWGDALDEFRDFAPAVRIINLETAITRSDGWLPKGINYRMHPDNIGCLTVAGIDCCVLANNHVLDWGPAGLAETLATLREAGVRQAGAGSDLQAARAPVVLECAGRGRVLVFAMGAESSGIPADWAATASRPGIDLLADLSGQMVARIAERVHAVKRPGDLVVASIHWGGNWGYAISEEQIRFAHGLIDEAAVDVVHGHSSHHVKGLEVYKARPIIYGCGDFLNDYEGIGGYEAYRGDLSLMYFPTLDAATGRLQRLRLSPMHIRRFRLHRAADTDARWLGEVLSREGRRFATSVSLDEDGRLSVQW